MFSTTLLLIEALKEFELQKNEKDTRDRGQTQQVSGVEYDIAQAAWLLKSSHSAVHLDSFCAT